MYLFLVEEYTNSSSPLCPVVLVGWQKIPTHTEALLYMSKISRTLLLIHKCLIRHSQFAERIWFSIVNQCIRYACLAGRISIPIILHYVMYPYMWLTGFIHSLESTVYTFNSCTRRPDFCQCLVFQGPIYNMSKNSPSTSKTHVACESKLHSFVRSSMILCQGNVVATGRAVVFHAWAAHTFSAGIKCGHCRYNVVRSSNLLPGCTVRTFNSCNKCVDSPSIIRNRMLDCNPVSRALIHGLPQN